MSASTGAIQASGRSSRGSWTWGLLAPVVAAALVGGTFLGRAIAPAPPATVRIVEPFAPATGSETLPSDVREQAALKAEYGRAVSGKGLTPVQAPASTVIQTETPRGALWFIHRQLAP